VDLLLTLFRMMSHSAKLSLREIFGDRFSDETGLLFVYSYDAKFERTPDAVVFPVNSDDVSRLLSLATEEGFPVVPRGAGTGQTGGSVPVEGGVVLSLERMNHILELDCENLTLTVEPGAITGDIKSYVARFGLYYPPDPASYAFSTIGGNIAENAGGIHAVKYGVTADYLLGLEVVLPTGEVISFADKLYKNVTGYDLRDIFVGSEGTLGVITRAVLKLIPAPEAYATALVGFPDLSSIRRLASTIRSISASACELIGKNIVPVLMREFQLPLPPETRYLILIEFDGFGDEPRRLLDLMLSSFSGVSFFVARDEAERERLWDIRRNISPIIRANCACGVSEDIVVPPASVPEMLQFLENLPDEFPVKIFSFGHAGDGNLHVNICYDELFPERELEQLLEALFRKTVSLGGALSGEHGVGIAKKRFLNIYLSEESIRLQRKLKRILDPRGILNPGKIFDE